MRRFRRIIPFIAISLLAGCFQVSTVVRVNPDGSGRVLETMLLSKKMIAQMNEMMRGFTGESGVKSEPIELFEPAKLKAQATGMGKGVSYLSGEKTETAEYSGYMATYEFKDINRLRLNQQSGDTVGAAVGGKTPSLPILFHFKKGSPATLTIEQPKGKNSVKTAETPGKEPESPQATKGVMSDEEAKQLMEMFMGMKMSLIVEVNGTIVETNATHRDGKRITIVDFDLSKLGSSLPQLEKLKRLKESSVAEAKELMKDLPGIKMDLNDRLRVVFRK
jgi:hypothetical protein